MFESFHNIFQLIIFCLSLRFVLSLQSLKKNSRSMDLFFIGNMLIYYFVLHYKIFHSWIQLFDSVRSLSSLLKMMINKVHFLIVFWIYIYLNSQLMFQTSESKMQAYIFFLNFTNRYSTACLTFPLWPQKQFSNSKCKKLKLFCVFI